MSALARDGRPGAGDWDCPASLCWLYSPRMPLQAGLRVASLALLGLTTSCIFDLADPLSSTTTTSTTTTTTSTTTTTTTDPCADAAGGKCCEPGDQIACGSMPGTLTGPCKPGVRTCLPGGNDYGACEGEVTPVIQDCTKDPDTDTDCNGKGCSGDLLWVRHFGGPANETANGVAIDSKGNLLVAGTFDGGLAFGGLQPLTSKGAKDIFLLKLDPDGAPQWARRFGGAEDDDSGALGRGPNVAVDAEDNVILTGTVAGTADLGGDKPAPGVAGDEDAFVLKVGPDGEFMWSKRFTGVDDQKGSGVAVDAQGNVLLTGAMQGTVDFGGGELSSQGGKDLFVVKLDPAGAHLWSRRLGEDGDQQGLSVAVGKAGEVVIAGDLMGTMTFGAGEGVPQLTSANPEKVDILVVKLDKAGKAIWARSFGKGEIGGDTILQRAGGVAVAPSGHVLVTGWFHSSLNLGNYTAMSDGKADVFLVRFEPGGQVNGLIRYGNTLDYQAGWGITSDAAGQILLTGNFTGDVAIGDLTHHGFDMTTDHPDAFVLKLDALLDPVWNKSLVGPDWQVGYGIAADVLGNVVVVGRMNGDITSGVPPIQNQGGDDIVVVKLAP
jgi:hypothetical protein